MPVIQTSRSSGFEGAPGMLADMLRGAESIEQVRALSPLPDEAQRIIDTVPVTVGLERLVVVSDILRRGLVFPLPNWLSVPEVDWEQISKVGHAIESMDPMARGENQIAARTLKRIPIFLTMDDFEFGFRLIATARRSGYQIDLSHAEQAVRRVNERLEDSAINGSSLKVNGNSVPGLLNAPNANTYAYTGGATWTGKTGAEIIGEIVNMIDLAQADNRFGPYHLWIPTLYGNKFNEDYATNYPKTIGARVSELRTGKDANGNDQFLTWSVADRLPADRTILCQMTRDVVDIIWGQSPTILSWSAHMHPLSPVNFCAIACAVLRVKDDSAGKSGIVTGNLT